MAVAKIIKEIIPYGQEFDIDPTTESIIRIEDNKDGNVIVFILSYLRKGE